MTHQLQFSEKPGSQPFTEPENMTTIDLGKGDNFSDDIKKTLNQDTAKFQPCRVFKSLAVGVGMFLLLGLCVTILILIIHKGYTKTQNQYNTTNPIKVIFSNSKKITACKMSKTFEDCCHLFFKPGGKGLEKCNVQKVLNLFLLYELEVNKRQKRQFDNYENDHDYNSYPSNYFQEEEYPILSYDEFNDYFENPNVISEPARSYDYVNYLPSNFEKSSDYERSALAHMANNGLQETWTTAPNIETTTADHNLKGNNLNIPRPISRQDVELTTPDAIVGEINPERCPDDNCPTVVKASSKIDKITDVNAEDGKIRIAMNNTKIQLRPNLKEKERISQGSDFEVKPSVAEQSSTQSKQANPCLYTIPGSVFPAYRPPGFDSNNFLVPTNLASQQQPLYVINPSVYPSIPMQYPGYNFPQPPLISKNPIPVTGAGGQFYLCNPVPMTSNNVAGLQGVEIRRMSDDFTLQEMLETFSGLSRFQNNKTREALNCPFGTQPCRDDSKCIQNRHVCDNEVNCHDASDEMSCSCKNRVGELRWCDGYLDCPDGEDEKNCFDCSDDEFSCDDWSRFHRGTCVPLDQRCDGIKQCEITGKDEEDCTILADHVSQHSLLKISNAAGFLHRNFKGKWYPTCFGADAFSLDVCKTEAGPTEVTPKTFLIETNDIYTGPFLDLSPSEGLTFADTCMKNKAAFVECPPLYCGLRLSIINPFRNAEVDTSAEEFLMQTHQHKSRNEPILAESRVVGGKPSQPTAWPWVVSIYKNGVFHCGGVLINEAWVLTAAHCVDKFWLYYYEVQAGILRRFSYSPMEQTRWATIAIPHDGYDKKTLKNDIALIKLSKPVRFNRYVRPICLPSEVTAGFDYLKGPKENTVCVTVGWGATIEHGTDPDHLREVEVPILPTCKHREDKEGDEICAGLFEGGKDACQGDSGGPLMCRNPKNKNQWYLAGIVSHGEGCARPNEPGVYTKVSKYIAWIQENSNGKTVGRNPLQKCPGYVCAGTKRCIPKKRHCDKIVDCLFGDDEFDCWQANDRSNSFSPNVLGSRRNVFGNLLDMLDDSSEESLENINKNKTSNKVKDSIMESLPSVEPTTLKSDEDEVFVNNFMCRNLLQLIPYNEKCNGVVNCEDGTDELDCSCVDYLRHSDKNAICDGVTDCKDMSDEAYCAKCRPDKYLCRISQKCIPLERRCDGEANCLHGEDEWDCVALTDGRTLVFDSDLRPKQSLKGIITINRLGVWRPLCSNASNDDAASISANVCNLLGFEEYTLFHQLSVADKPLNVTIDGFQRNHSVSHELPLCEGLFVRCLNVSLVDDLHQHRIDNVTRKLELYTFPWNAVIYVDGEFRCTGTILNPYWIITARACFAKPLQTDVYIAALLGKGKAHLDVEGPHEQVISINELAIVEGDEVIVLRSQQRIDFNRYVRPAQITAKSRFVNEQCIAIGLQGEKSKVVTLKAKKLCNTGFRCFEIFKDDCKHQFDYPWSGIITCNSRNEWYTAASFTNLQNPCELSQVQLPEINNMNVRLAMGSDLLENKAPKCNGFRCILGKCIPKNKTCDGIFDCRSNEDEEFTACGKSLENCHLTENCANSQQCTWSQFRCKNGQCIPKESFCDTINDCGDHSDEPEECSCRTYLETVHPEKICDGTVNCWDRSDERPELCKCNFPANVTCGQTNLCVSNEMVCDGFRDCPRGEDESRCYSLKTTLESVNRGEVIRRTAGVWHSGCFARNYTTSELEEICERLGFAGGSAKELKLPEGNEAMKPVLDRFDVVWVRSGHTHGFRIQFRTGNAPYMKFVQDPKCHKLFIECF